MNELANTLASMRPVATGTAEQAQKILDQKTKPVSSLGRLEELACKLCGIYRTTSPKPLVKAIVVMAADHGIADEGVSAYPQIVTAQMLANFVRGGAAINVLAGRADAKVVIADMGTKNPPSLPTVRSHRIGNGTANFRIQPAMTRLQAVSAIEAGIRLANELIDGGINVIGVGEMGIANTTSASAITAVMLDVPAELVTGAGTGIDDVRRQHKISVIEQARQLHRPDRRDPIDVLTKVGGFEIGGLAGVMLASAARGIPVVLDGFITTASALLADGLHSEARQYFIAAHQSTEPGHRLALEKLGLKPLLDLHLRLGEGTGAALALLLLDAALAVLFEMASFDEAGVSRGVACRHALFSASQRSMS
ncbi:MAG: nicotinate-nucleotide--dimethylbenzimidazole phosphoribosyltransferase [Gemmatales bacterium]|nr:MAG: nicotinate-nucleotide--dimethylbenzimidazole phosphoribosyltransferase [Gemmatales bacterium]